MVINVLNRGIHSEPTDSPGGDVGTRRPTRCITTLWARRSRANDGTYQNQEFFRRQFPLAGAIGPEQERTVPSKVRQMFLGDAVKGEPIVNAQSRSVRLYELR